MPKSGFQSGRCPSSMVSHAHAHQGANCNPGVPQKRALPVSQTGVSKIKGARTNSQYGQLTTRVNQPVEAVIESAIPSLRFSAMLPTSSIFVIFAFSFALALGAVVSPGPVSAAIVTQAPRRGWIVGPLVATGHSILELIIVVLIAYGLTTTQAHVGIRSMIALVGGLLLLWMGASMIRDVWRKRVQISRDNEDKDTMSNLQLVGLGMVTTLSNPFWYAWWITVAAGYLAQAQNLSAAAVGAFFLGHISADYAWDTLLSTVIGSGRNWITPKVYAFLILVCGGFLVYLGVVFLLEGFSAF